MHREGPLRTKLHSINSIERLNCEIKRPIKVVDIFSNQGRH